MREDQPHERLDRWFRDHADQVLAYLLHRTDPQTAQDLVQDVFVVAFRKADRVPEPPIGWLLATARRLLANKTRGFRRQNQLLERIAEEAAECSDLKRAEALYVFRDLLEALSARDREVLTLTGWYGLGPTDAAEALGCTPTAYAVRLHRARQRLADELSRTGAAGGSPSLHLAEVFRDN